MNYKFIKLEKLFNEIKEKNKKILVISSNFHSKKKYFTNLVHNLKKKNIVNIFIDVSSGAPINNVYSILNKFYKPDLIIGVGGGSVMDVAKACSCLFYQNKSKNITKIKILKKIKTILVPTILGSGAESSKGAILKDRKDKKIAIRHDLIKAESIFLDLDIVKLAKNRIMCEALYDCFSHAIETYISNFSTKSVKKRSLKALNFFLNVKSKSFFKKKQNLKKLAKFSIFMGQNLVESTTCLPHRIQYSLSEFTKATHAQGINALHKGWLFCSLETSKFKKLGKDLKIDNKRLYRNIMNLRNRLKINYSLTNLGIKQKHLKKISKKTIGRLNADPLYINRKSIITILENSL